ncbi:MAG: phosphate signaling complex protein PhoU [Clostridiales bacterium]|nr:phosphate signaling complex protein PhoU [Clostridiales bacterium]
MRDSYVQQLDKLHGELIKMGSLCEEAIGCAVKGLLEEDERTRARAIEAEREIDVKEREIEAFCIRLLLREQPVAGDLRRIAAAQKMITDMERVGDHAEDIAELARFIDNRAANSGVHIADMAAAAAKMLTDAIDAFVAADLGKVRAVQKYDDVVDELFTRIRGELVARITRDPGDAAVCLDLLMIAKYLERIGDHAQNIAEWVDFSITGEMKGVKVMSG